MTQTALLHNIAAYDYALTTMTVTSIMGDVLFNCLQKNNTTTYNSATVTTRTPGQQGY